VEEVCITSLLLWVVGYQVAALLEQRVCGVYNTFKKDIAANGATAKGRMDELATPLEAVKIAALGR